MIPQAFTTRDMSEAFKWLHTLPPAVRDEMKSMEQVVAFYLKSKRMGGALPSKEDLEAFKGSDHSKNNQDFQKTLKSLKTELDRFDFSSQPAPPQPQHPQNFPNPQNTQHTSHSQQPQQGQTTSERGTAPTQPTPPTQGPRIQEEHTSPSHNILSVLRMDPKSRQIINEIRDELNLSSDIEVLRMSLVLAHKTLRDLLKS